MIRFLDSVDHYATVDITEKWTQSYTMAAGLFVGTGSQPATVGVGTGRRSTQSMRFRCAWQASPLVPAGSPVCYDAAAVGRTLVTTGTLAVVGFAFKASGDLTFSRIKIPTALNGQNIALMGDGSANYNRSWIVLIREAACPHIGLTVHSNGELQVWRGEGQMSWDAEPTFLGDSAGQALSMEQYYYLELRVALSGTVGTVKVYVNGDLWIDLGPINTLGKYDGLASTPSTTPLPATWDEVVIGAYRSTELSGPATNVSGYWDYDDLYVVDNDATDPLNTPVDVLGDCRIDYLQPLQDDLQGWTPLSGVQHYAMVDEIPPDDDVTYNYTDVLDAIDTFVTEPPPILNADLVAMAPIFSRKRVGGGNTATQPVWRVNLSNYLKPAAGDTGTYTFRQGVWTLNPDTMGVITYAAYIASSVGYKKQA